MLLFRHLRTLCIHVPPSALAATAPSRLLKDIEASQQPPQHDEDEEGGQAPASQLLRTESRNYSSQGFTHHFSLVSRMAAAVGRRSQ